MVVRGIGVRGSFLPFTEWNPGIERGNDECGARSRFAYQLTSAGRELAVVLSALQR
jgi:hypothetical protein